MPQWKFCGGVFMRSFSVWLLALGLIASPAMGLDGNGDSNAKPVSQTEVQELRDLIRAQAAQLEEQRRLLQQEQERVLALEQRLGTASNNPAPAVAVTPQSAAVQPEGPAKALVEKSTTAAKTAPLSFKIGAAEFTPGGFADFSTVYRSKNVGSGTATSFGAIPYNNTPAGNASEFRIGGQSSRVTLKVDSQLGNNKVLGYLEADFNGNAPGGTYVTSNSNTLRMRMYMVDVRRDKFEVLAGQAWTMMTPNRRGVGAMPSDLFIPMTGDANYQVGLLWARQSQFRFIYHPTKSWAAGFSVENPEQYVGGAVVFPSGLSTGVSTQFDNGSNTATPNLRPDLIAKVAHDQNLGGGRNWHVEMAGMMRTFKVVTPGSWVSSTATGGGVSLNNIIDLTKSFRLIGTTFWSDGGGRYIVGMGPDVVVRPISVGGHTTAQLGLVHSGTGIAGFEWQTDKNTVLSGYYGAAYFGRYGFADTTSSTAGALAGFGYTGSSNSANRAIQEATLAMQRALWKDPSYGSLLWVTQTSYVTRSPWYVSAGSPKNAHMLMGFMGLRYTLP
jgi:hypothetical protein